jgi:RNA polymerase sigma factor (sigma-70 family)
MKKQERALIERAATGENVRDEIILALQHTLYTMAGRYTGKSTIIERMDLVNEANIAMLEEAPRAVTKQNPFSYLLRVARLAMIDCINGRGDSIRVSSYKDRLLMVSLDQPDSEGVTLAESLPDDTYSRHLLSEEVVSRVRSCLNRLPEKASLVIERHYGIGYEPTPLNEISRLLSPKTRRPDIARYHHDRALAHLRANLNQEYYPMP